MALKLYLVWINMNFLWREGRIGGETKRGTGGQRL